MKTTNFRWMPSLVAGALLLVAAMGAATHDDAPPRAVPDAMYYPNCDDSLQSGPLEQKWITYGGTDFLQPVHAGFNVAACSLYVDGPARNWIGAEAWDPVAMAPDPHTLQLRTAFFQVSGSNNVGQLRMDFVPPLVVKAVHGVAEPPQPMVDIRFSPKSADAPTYVGWAPAGAASVPSAYMANGGSVVPMLGSHPVLAHWVCGGDAALQNLYVTQSIVRADMLLDSVECYVQRFRVPTRTQLSFVELAFGLESPSYPAGPGSLAILDAAGQSVPPSQAGVSLAAGDFPVGWTIVPSWASHTDFTSVVELEPAHDYWLWVETKGRWRLYSRRVTGAETAVFTSGIGPLYRRGSAGETFALDPARTLDFKIIGIPDDPTGVPEPIALVSPLRLHVMPNPARGASLVTWSGASGRVRFDVMDQAGRRVSGGSPAAGASGQWLWRATTDAGRAVAAGVYFVRATDAAGHAAVERVVVVR